MFPRNHGPQSFIASTVLTKHGQTCRFFYLKGRMSGRTSDILFLAAMKGSRDISPYSMALTITIRVEVVRFAVLMRNNRTLCTQFWFLIQLVGLRTIVLVSTIFLKYIHNLLTDLLFFVLTTSWPILFILTFRMCLPNIIKINWLLVPRAAINFPFQKTLTKKL